MKTGDVWLSSGIQALLCEPYNQVTQSPSDTCTTGDCVIPALQVTVSPVVQVILWPVLQLCVLSKPHPDNTYHLTGKPTVKQ